VVATLSATPASAQQRIPVAGRVIRVGADSIPAPNVPLVLHQVGRNAQGPLDSTTSDAQGRFGFRYPADTTSLYLLSARYAGIEYFSPPLNTNPDRPDTAVVVAVFDTSSTQPVVQAARYLVIRRAEADGSRGVLDLIVLENRGQATRLAGDSTRPAWSGPLPRGISGVRVGEADLSADAIEVQGDSLLVFAPIAPGEKQISLEYAIIPGTPLRLRFDQDSVATNVLTQDGVRVDGSEMVAVDSQVIEGQSFQRWVGAPHAGEEIRIRFAGMESRVPGWLLPAMVGLAGAVLLFAIVKRRPRRAGQKLETLTDRMALLDARYAGREEEVPAEEWQQYQAEREKLRAELAGYIGQRSR
jgi:hypothetical protein